MTMTINEPPPAKVKGKPFGGRVEPALIWEPLPYMDDYLENMRINEHPWNYRRMARTGLGHFANYANAAGITHPDELTRTHILHFQVYVSNLRKSNGEPLAVSYRQQLLKYVRAWINWLEDLDYIETNPWIRIKVGSVKKKPKPLEDDEVAQLFDTHRQQAFSIAPFAFHRREVALTLLYSWGLRLHELNSLNVSALDMRLDWVIVRNKGGGTKTLPYGPELKQIIQRWLVWRGKHGVVGEDALLIDQSGKRLSTSMIYKIITELGARSGVAINPHRLRDTFGTVMLDNDVPIERISKMMGHTNRAQTLAYARVNDKKLAESHGSVMGPLLDKLVGGKAT